MMSGNTFWGLNFFMAQVLHDLEIFFRQIEPMNINRSFGIKYQIDGASYHLISSPCVWRIWCT